MANAIYPKAKEAFLSGSINLTSDTIKCALVKTSSGYTYSSAHQYYSDLTPGSNVFGTPVMKNKVVVMDARSVNTLQFDTMRTYLYDPGPAYKPATNTTAPRATPPTAPESSWAGGTSCTRSSTRSRVCDSVRPIRPPAT